MNNTIEVSREDLELIRDALDSAASDEVVNLEEVVNALTVVQVYLDNLELVDNGSQGWEGADAEEVSDSAPAEEAVVESTEE